MGNVEKILMTVDVGCKLVGPDKFIETDLQGTIEFLDLFLKVIEP